MTTAPDTNIPPDRNHESPRWLGSALLRGLAQEHGVGWAEDEVNEEEARPKWLGSVARREGTHGDDSGWVDPEEAERPFWLGSAARRGDPNRSLVLIDMQDEPGEWAPEEPAETPQTATDPSTSAGSSPSLKETLKPQASDELGDRRKSQEVAGELG
ncbi:MAG: hypothetical protein ACYDHO_04345 [Gaiellaceae bacterium]